MSGTPPPPSRRRVALAAAGAVALGLLGAGCGDDGGPGSGGIEVVATTTVLGDLVRQVAGPGADVTQILQPNTDAHDYEPRPQDVGATAEARVVFASGDDLDPWIEEVVAQSGGDARLVDVSRRLEVRVPGDEEGSTFDPHWWHDPRNTLVALTTIRDALAAADPQGRAAYTRNAAAYAARVHRLDAGIARCFAEVPAGERKLVTDHDAFGYFARRYDLDVVGAVIPSQTTRAQASAGDVARLARVIEREGVKAVFAERSVTSKVADAIADQTGASAEYDLYGDALGAEGTPGATYLGMERANADAMVRGFTGGRGSCAIRGL